MPCFGPDHTQNPLLRDRGLDQLDGGGWGSSRPKQGQTEDGLPRDLCWAQDISQTARAALPTHPQPRNDLGLGGGGQQRYQEPRLRACPKLACGVALATIAQRQGHPHAHTHPSDPVVLPGGAPKPRVSEVTPRAAPPSVPRAVSRAGVTPQPSREGPGDLDQSRFNKVAPWSSTFLLCPWAVEGAAEAGEEEGIAEGVKHPLFLY